MLAATLLAVVLRAFHLGSQSLWIDEVFTWLTADIGRPFHLSSLLQNIHGPLYSLILYGWGALAGDSEWALRLPSLVFGVATVPAAAWLAARWLGRDTAAPAAWLAAGSPFLVWYSQEARNYMLLVLCVCLAGAMLLGPVRRRAAPLLGYAAAAGAALLSNFSFALLLPLHLRWWFAGAGRDRAVARRRLVELAGVGAVLLVLFLPWVPQLLRSWDWRRLHPGGGTAGVEAPLRGRTTFHAAGIPFTLHAMAVGYTLGPSLHELHAGPAGAALRRHVGELAAVSLVFGALGLAGIVAVARRRRLLDLVLGLGVPLAVVSFFALRNFKAFNPRYLAVSAPLVLLVLAAGLTALRRPWRIAAALAIALLWGASLGHLYFDPAYAKEDYRDALRLVSLRSRPGEKVLAVGAEEPIYYYYRGPLPVDRLWLGFVARPGRMDEELAGKLAGARGTWVVLSRSEDLDPGNVFARTLERGHPGAEAFRFAGVRVWHVPWGAGAAASP